MQYTPTPELTSNPTGIDSGSILKLTALNIHLIMTSHPCDSHCHFLTQSNPSTSSNPPGGFPDISMDPHTIGLPTNTSPHGASPPHSPIGLTPTQGSPMSDHTPHQYSLHSTPASSLPCLSASPTPSAPPVPPPILLPVPPPQLLCFAMLHLLVLLQS